MNIYFFNVPGFGIVDFRGATKSKARYALWKQFSEAYPCTFFQFMQKVK